MFHGYVKYPEGIIYKHSMSLFMGDAPMKIQFEILWNNDDRPSHGLNLPYFQRNIDA